MNCESVCLIIFSHSFTITLGTAEICSSVWETFQAVALNFRVSSIALMQIVNQHIPKKNPKEHHSIILHVIVLMFLLKMFALHWRIFYVSSFFIFVC